MKNETKISELATKAKKVINDIIYITLATSNKNHEPWNSPVYCAFNTDYIFYWASWIGNQHSKNIKENENVFVVIYDSTVPEGTGFGVYMKGKACQLKKTNIIEIIKSLKLLYDRKKKKPRKPQEFLGLFPRRIFKFVPDKIWVNSEGNMKGNFIDARIDITKEMLQ